MAIARFEKFLVADNLEGGWPVPPGARSSGAGAMVRDAAASARGRTYNSTISAVQGWVVRLHAALFRASGGRIGGRMVNCPVLLLNTTGRKSGKMRTTPLLYLQDDDSYAIVASNGGTAAHPAWWHNLHATPEATVEVGGCELRVRAEEAGPSERKRLWPLLVAMYPPYEDYQKKTDREIPVLLLRPSENV